MERIGVGVIERFDNEADQAEAAAQLIAGALRAGVDERARASFVATGGSTPGAVYDRLARIPLPWERVVVTLSDERWSPADRNETLVRERLLVGTAAKARFMPLFHGDTLARDAERAEDVIPSLAPFDAVQLGMGPDGHIASLFPGKPETAEGLNLHGHRLAVGVAIAGLAPYVPRISLTLRALTAARLIVMVIRGSEKLKIVERGAGDLPVAALLNQTLAPLRVLWAP